MIVEINTEHLIKSGLTANQYLLALLIYERSYTAYTNLKNSFPQIVADDIKELTNKGFIFQSTNRLGYTITAEFLVYCSKKDMFDALVERFPIYVIRTDGTKDYLRTDRIRSKRRYDNITRHSKSKHELIMKCLDFELSTREVEGNLKYMKRLPNWLESQEWETWQERLENESTIVNTPKYGTNLE